MGAGASLGPAWRVRRTGGLLVPGFTKRFDDEGRGMTYLWRIPVGWFDVVTSGGPAGGVELRYRRWPVVDRLDRRPAAGGSIRSAGFVAIGGRRVRFCRFRLER